MSIIAFCKVFDKKSEINRRDLKWEQKSWFDIVNFSVFRVYKYWNFGIGVMMVRKSVVTFFNARIPAFTTE